MRRLVLGTGRAAVLAACVFALAVSTTAAADFLAGDALRVDASETIDGDLFASGRSVIVNGTVEGDLVVAAMTVEINGEVMGSVDAAAGTVSVGGTVGGSVRAAAGDVTVSGDIDGDLVVAAGSLALEDQSRVSGDVGGGAGQVRLSGTVTRDVTLRADELEVLGTVRGDIDVQVGRLTVGPSATITGDVRYTSAEAADVAGAATIGGVVQQTEPAERGPSSYLPDHPIVTFVGLALGLLLLGGLMLTLRPVPTMHVGEELRDRPLLTLGAGLAGWIAQFLVLIGVVLIAVLLSQLAGAIGGALFFVAAVFGLLMVLVALVAQVYVALGIGEVVGRAAHLPPRLTYAVGAIIVAALLTVAGSLHGIAFVFAYLFLWILGLGSFLLYQARRREAEGGSLVWATGSAALPAGGGSAARVPRGRANGQRTAASSRSATPPASAVPVTAAEASSADIVPPPAGGAGVPADSGEGPTARRPSSRGTR